MTKLGDNSAPDMVIAPAIGVAQSATRLKMPAAGRVIKLGSYIRALELWGPLDYRLCLWEWGGGVGAPNKLLGRSALHTVSAALALPANLTRVTWVLETPVELAPNADIMVGLAWETNPERQAQLGGYSGSGLRYRKSLAEGASWPVTMTDCVAVTDHDFVAWIDDYEPMSGVWVYRSGEWRQADEVLIRSAGWVSIDAVKVRRSGVWTDAS